jgi:predicted transcriptional regulator
MTIENQDVLLPLTADVVAAYVSNNPVPATQLTELITSIHNSLSRLSGNGSVAPDAETLKPAVPIKKSVMPDFIVSLEDGKKFKSLKRHLQTSYGMTPAEYRAKWGLPSDYPMVAPNYAAARSQLAKTMGLGRKPKQAAKPARKPSRRQPK